VLQMKMTRLIAIFFCYNKVDLRNKGFLLFSDTNSATRNQIYADKDRSLGRDIEVMRVSKLENLHILPETMMCKLLFNVGLL
jgi:hypothetical protein